jgi:hypothetical protein
VRANKLTLVMARLDRAIQEQKMQIFQQCLDGRVKPGHDMMKEIARNFAPLASKLAKASLVAIHGKARRLLPMDCFGALPLAMTRMNGRPS